MDYHTFSKASDKVKAYETSTDGVYLGEDKEGNDIYKLNEFYVKVKEDTKGYFYEPTKTKPDLS